MTGTTRWEGPEPPPGQRFCSWHAALIKGDEATVQKDRITGVRDGEEMTIGIPETPPLAVAQTLVLLPLPPQAAQMGMPPSMPTLLDVCWDCLNGITVLKSALAIAGAGVKVT